MSKVITNNITPRSGSSVGLTGDLTASGNITGTTGTFSGSVSVGGTITYEDVTNIDSVGIVTARTGVRVNAGGLVVTAGVSTLAADLSIADKIIHTGDTNTAIRFPADDTFTVETAGSERVRVGAGGSVGINETTPDSKVDILHSTATNGATENLIHLRTDPGAGYVDRGLFVKIGKDGVYDNSAVHYDIVGSAGNSGFHAFEVQGNEKLRIDRLGKVGIGTSSPGAKLDIKHNSANEHLRLTEQTSGKYSAFGVDTSDNLRIYVNNSERMRITSTGRIRANTSSEQFGEKYLFNNDEGTSGFVLNQASTADHTGMLIRHARGGLSGFTAAAVSFRGNDSTQEGSITMGVSSVSFNTSSDYRLKENQQSIVDGIERVKRLSPYRFNFIKDPDTTVDGFFAHEAQTVVPEAVTGTHNEVDADGNAVMQGIDQSKLVPLLTAALQEAIAKIETLEQRLSDAGIA